MRQAAVVLVVLLAAACQFKPESARESAATAAQPVTGPAASAEVPAPAAVTGEIGVPECDKYLTRWDECLATKVPAETREAVKVAIDAQREMWKSTAATPEGKAGLAGACAEAAELARMQLPSYGCAY